MSKQVKVKVLSNGTLSDGFRGLRDTTVGKSYAATQYDKGEPKSIDGQPAGEDGFQFVDDVGDMVFVWNSQGAVEIVES